MENIKIGCVLMAAGNALRFGENKLASEINGKSLIQHAFDAIPESCFFKVAVVTQYPEIIEMAKGHGYIGVYNKHPYYGISHTIKLGIDKLCDCDAIMFMVSDQPLLKRESIESEINFFRKNRDYIVALSHNGIRGNPCIFPRSFFDALCALKEDHGGSSVIRENEDKLKLFEVSREQLTDIDKKSDISKIQK